MRKKISNVSRLIVPNKKINIFVISILILGVITGSIFMLVLMVGSSLIGIIAYFLN